MRGNKLKTGRAEWSVGMIGEGKNVGEERGNEGEG